MNGQLKDLILDISECNFEMLLFDIKKNIYINIVTKIGANFPTNYIIIK